MEPSTGRQAGRARLACWSGKYIYIGGNENIFDLGPAPWRQTRRPRNATWASFFFFLTAAESRRLFRDIRSTMVCSHAFSSLRGYRRDLSTVALLPVLTLRRSSSPILLKSVRSIRDPSPRILLHTSAADSRRCRPGKRLHVLYTTCIIAYLHLYRHPSDTEGKEREDVEPVWTIAVRPLRSLQRLRSGQDPHGIPPRHKKGNSRHAHGTAGQSVDQVL